MCLEFISIPGVNQDIIQIFYIDNKSSHIMYWIVCPFLTKL